MAEGNIAEDGNSGWKTGPSTIGERSFARRNPAISASRWGDSWRPGRCFFSERVLALMKAIADTGFVVAFARLNDQHHKWAVDIAKGITEPLLTCEAVLAESAFHLESSGYVLSLVEDEMLRIAFDCNRNIEHLSKIAERYQDRKPNLADLCLIRMSELYPRHAIITVDENDFRVYRRNKREAIPLMCPPHGGIKGSAGSGQI
jgi:uncharacterized protein